MSVRDLMRDNIRRLEPYKCARDEAGSGMRIYLDANENWAPIDGCADINRYPDSSNLEVREAVGRAFGLPASSLAIGNGSDELIDLLIRIFCTPGKDSILVLPPTYGEYSVLASINDVRVVECPLREDFSIDEEATAEMMRRHRPKLTFFCSPNNPSGNSLCRDVMLRLAALNEGITVLDEAYIDFTDKPGITLEDIRANDRIVVLRTLSKAWALAGARIGIMLACDEILEASYNVKYPYNISRPAATEAIKALSCTDAFRRRLEEEKANRAWLMEAMRALPIVRQVLSSDANFFLARFDEPRRIYEELKGRGIVLRDRSGMLHCDGCLRITVGSRSECEELVRTLEELCS